MMKTLTNNFVNYKNLTRLLIALVFALAFIVKGIASLLFFMTVLLGGAFLISYYKKIKFYSHEIILIVILLLNFFSILINQISNFDFNIKEYDYGIRYLAAVFTYILIRKNNLNFNKELLFGIGLSIFLIAISFLFIYRNDVFNTRTHTFFVDPNTISVYLSIYFIIIMQFNYKINYIYKFFMFISWVLAIYLIIQSQSRGGWIGLAAGLGFIFINSVKTKNLKNIYFILIIFVCVLFYYIANDTFSARFNSISSEISGRLMDNHNTSTGDRITLTFLGLDMIKNSYLFGINYANAREIIESLGLYSKYQSHIFDIFYCCGFHNQFTTMLVKYGVFGLMSFLSLFIYILYLNIKYKNYFSSTIISVVICYLVSSISLETISLKYTQSIFLLLLVYGYALTSFEIQERFRAKQIFH